ncbi:SAC3 domain-containing protein 1 isoform X2 [Cimex lectularius]|nr:SAC3 domain-containing protein 1 isoform X2 [Cimex lectularius]XP_024081143.1 SAC3 domain-containing protein 1 isoform X2 [Cimex lectularius]XP_024081144.1 SAC3 domain-containing protein 1 isoform X2 [Cimex lectularius]
MKTEDNYIVGMCQDMCPVSEVKMRISKNLVHDLEKSHGELIKCYKRSAAGTDISNPKTLRPPNVLEETVHYLFNNVLMNKSKQFHVVYQFVEDRLRAVRQDLFIQQPSPDKCFPVLEPIVRFYIYSAYRLSESPLEDFDPVLNHNQLLETFKWLLKLYDSWNHISPERFEIEALYSAFNLGEPSSLFRSLTLPSRLRRGIVLTAEQLSISWYLGNYAKICKCLSDLPVLMAALIYAVQQPYIKRHALRVMNSAYSSKVLTVPLSLIKDQLLFNDERDLLSYLFECSLETVNGETKAVKFSKNNAISERLPRRTRLESIDRRLDEQYLPDLLLTTPSL